MLRRVEPDSSPECRRTLVENVDRNVAFDATQFQLK